MQSSRLVLPFLLVLGLAACQPQLLPTTPHLASSPESVKIYDKKPMHYEDLGTLIIPITAEIKWDDHGDCKPGFEAMKKKAAELGANGVLLDVAVDSESHMVVVGDGEKYHMVPVTMKPKAAVVKAIFVVQE